MGDGLGLPEWVPWILVIAFLISTIIYRSLYRVSRENDVLISEFVAITMLEQKAYENNRSVFLSLLKRQEPIDHPESTYIVVESAGKLAKLFVQKLGPSHAIRSVLIANNYIKPLYDDAEAPTSPQELNKQIQTLRIH